MSYFLNRQRRPYDWSWLSNHTSRSIIFCYVISISFHTFVFYVRCRQNYAFFFNPPRKSQEICKLSANYHKTSTSIILSTFSKAVPARTTWRRPLWSDNLIAKRFRAPEDGYILPFSRRVSVPCEGNRRGLKDY